MRFLEHINPGPSYNHDSYYNLCYVIVTNKYNIIGLEKCLNHYYINNN